MDEGREILRTTQRRAEKAKEVATGWEPRLRIAIEASLNYPRFFQVLAKFLNDHGSLEIDICESIFSGGWEALEQGRVDLIVNDREALMAAFPAYRPQRNGDPEHSTISYVLISPYCERPQKS